ncbi:MAG: nitroreductase family protein [Methanomassiliicoccales archaeon]
MIDHELLYNTIFKRKSIRKFLKEPLKEENLIDVMDKSKEIFPFLPEIKTEFKLVPPDEIRGMFKVPAPHYLAIYSEQKDGYLPNAGFMLQQMDLYLSSHGIGSCWQGSPKPPRELREISGKSFIIMLALGKPEEPLHRMSLSEFKRYPLTKITDIQGKETLLEAARLAPSGMNKQPWFFTGSEDIIDAYVSTSLVMKELNEIDLGIALCHLWLAGLHFGYKIELNRKGPRTPPPKGYAYGGSIRLL